MIKRKLKSTDAECPPVSIMQIIPSKSFHVKVYYQDTAILFLI